MMTATVNKACICIDPDPVQSNPYYLNIFLGINIRAS